MTCRVALGNSLPLSASQSPYLLAFALKAADPKGWGGCLQKASPGQRLEGSGGLSHPAAGEAGTIFGNATVQISKVVTAPRVSSGLPAPPQVGSAGGSWRCCAHPSLESETLLLQWPSEAGSKVTATPGELRTGAERGRAWAGYILWTLGPTSAK